MRKRWKIKKNNPALAEIAKRNNLNPVIVQLLLNREIKEEEFHNFLNIDKTCLYDPLSLPDIKIASKRINDAIKNNEKIALFGDYDVDGITSLSIFNDYIKDTKANFSFYIPHRLNDGFGLNLDAIKKIKNEGANLLITFDCGTNAVKEIEYAKSLGIDTIVIDHHTPHDNFNAPYAFVNPKRKDSNYPFSDLSNGAVTFKLVQALKGNDCSHLLDLVALSTICDVVPLKGENRVIIKEGLKTMRKAKRLALDVLCQSSGIKPGNIDTFHLGFILGPRINASGRVNTAYDALNMFLTQDKATASSLASKLEECNRKRRLIESQVLQEAVEQAEKDKDDRYSFVVYSQGWHTGVLGIVASRLVDRYYRPVFVVGFNGDLGRGSARSIDGFNIVKALGKCENYCNEYGGHKKAAGLEINFNDIEKFKSEFEKTAREMIKTKDLIPVLNIDMQIKFSDINMPLVDDLEKFKPFGEGNIRPMFTTNKVLIKQKPKKVTKRMYSAWLCHDGFTYEAVFGQNNGFHDIINYTDKCDIVYSIEENRYHNNVRLLLKDVRIS